MGINIKTPEQIDGIRASCQLSAKTLHFAENQLRPGLTTNELDDLCYTYIRDHGGTPACLGYLGFPKSICTSVNDVICHGIPNDKPLREGDIIGIDVSTILNGYYGDTCGTFPIGKIKSSTERLIRVARSCLKKGVETVYPGAFVGDIGQAITQYAIVYGFSVVVEYCGHGVGLALHEEPNIPHVGRKGQGAELRPGMVFTIEPMICENKAETIILEDAWSVRTKDHGLSAQFEHTILVTETGHEILTKIIQPEFDMNSTEDTVQLITA